MPHMRLVSAILFAFASAALAYDVVHMIRGSGFAFHSLGEMWYRLHAPSLNLAQAGIQRHVAAWLWDPGVVAILRLPAFFVFLAPAGLFLVLARRPSAGASSRRALSE